MSNRPTYYINGDLDKQCLLDVWDFLDCNPNEDVVVLINSSGGVSQIGWELFRSFQQHGRVMVKIHRAESAAAMAALGGRWRVAANRSRMFLHNPSSPESRAGKLDFQVKRQRQLYSAAIARETGQDIKTVTKWLRKTRSFDSFGMAAAGLVHCVDDASGDDFALLKLRCVRDMANRLGGGGHASLGSRAASILRKATRNFGKPNR